MKTCTLLMLCALSLATAGTATADPAPRDARVDGLPPDRILAIVRATGFDPMGRPERNGDLYVVRALDPNDIAYRLSIDSRTGRTVSMREIATPGPYEAAPAYARNRGPIYGWIFGPKDDRYGAPRPPRTVPQPRQDAATPLPRPRPYVAEANGSIPSNSAKPAEPQTAPEAQTASAPPSPGSQTAPELNAAPQSTPASEPPNRNGGASMPPVAPLD